MSRPDPAPKGSTEPATAQRPTRTRLAHFAIFNPSIPPPSRSARPTSETEPPDTLQHVDASHDYPARGTDGDTGDDQSGEHLEVDKDDLEQAAQIVFYTCPSDKNVERDVMLRQVGLVRGLMAFTSAVAPGDETWWSVHSNNARMVVYIADGYHFYANLLNARGWSDRMVADLLKRAYEDFCLLHGSLPLIPTEKDRANIRIFYNSFSDTLDTSYLSLAASDRLSSWIGHTQSSHLYTSAVNGALDVFKDDINDTNDPDPRTGSTLSEIGILTPTQTYECSNPALERYLRSRLIAALPVPSPPRPIGSRRPAQRTREDTRKVSLGSWAWPFGSRPSTPAGDNAVHGRAGEQSLGGVPAGASGSARTSIDTSRGSLNGPATVSPQAAVVGVGAEQKSTWLGLGTVPSAIGGAVGSMGTIFGLRSHDAAKPSTIKASELFPEAAQPAGNEAGKPHFTPGAESASAGQAPGADDKTMRDTLDTQSIRSVLEPSVPLSELADAQTDQRSIAAQVDWEGRDFHLGENGWRRVEWTVREGILLFMVHPPSAKQGEEGSEEAAQPPVADSHVLSLFNKLGSILSPEPTTKSTASSSSRHASGRYGPKPDSAIWPSEGMTHQVGEKSDMSLGVFADLRDTMLRHENVDEIYTRTSAPVPQKGNTASAPGLGSGNTPAGDAAKSASVGVKRIEGGEVYLAVGKTDASLVDADNAMRNMLRSDPRVTA